MADVSSATKFWPTAKEGFTTTTSGSVASGASTVGLNSVTGYSNGEVVCLVIDPTDTTKKQVFTGVVDTSGVQITGVVWTEGTNQGHSAGATVVDYETATAWALQAKGLLVEHTQAGLHSKVNGNTVPSGTDTVTLNTATQTLTNKTLTSPTITGTVIANANLSTAAGEIGAAWASWTPTWTNFTVGNGTVTALYKQIGKVVLFRLGFVFGSTSSVGGVVSYSLPATSVAYPGTSTVHPLGISKIYDTSTGNTFNGSTYWASTTTGRVKWFQVSGTAITDTDTSSTAPMTWATGDELYIEGFYEAA